MFPSVKIFFLYPQNLLQNTEIAYILYNDQPPLKDVGDRWEDNSGNRGGHTKGERQSSLALKLA